MSAFWRNFDALQVVIFTIFDAASDENFVKMMIFPVSVYMQCRIMLHRIISINLQYFLDYQPGVGWCFLLKLEYSSENLLKFISNEMLFSSALFLPYFEKKA